MAENALDSWMGAPERERTPVLMRSMIDLCLMQTGADEHLFRSNTPLSPLVCERIKQWENVFVNVPNFKPSLETGTQLMIDRHHKIKAAISENHGHIDTGNLKERVFSVPATCSFKEVKKKVDEENFKFVGDLTPLLDRMNEFANETMPNIRFSLHENGQHWIIFEASNLSEEDHTEALKDRLSGAWGEHLKYTGTLVGSKEVLPGWDVEGLRIEQSKNTAKPKKPHL